MYLMVKLRCTARSASQILAASTKGPWTPPSSARASTLNGPVVTRASASEASVLDVASATLLDVASASVVLASDVASPVEDMAASVGCELSVASDGCSASADASGIGAAASWPMSFGVFAALSSPHPARQTARNSDRQTHSLTVACMLRTHAREPMDGLEHHLVLRRVAEGKRKRSAVGLGAVIH